MSASMLSLEKTLLTTREICVLLEISQRAFKQMRALKAVDAANGTGKTARYTANHVEQARRLLQLMATAGLSMSVAAAHLRADGVLSKASNMSKLRLAVEACLRGSVLSLGAGVYLAVDPQLRSCLQSQLLKELKRCAVAARHIGSVQQSVTASVRQSRVHRAR